MVDAQVQADDERQDQRITREITWRYVIALLLVACLSTAAWYSLHLVIAEQASTAALVNVSGRQRMLSQRTALFSNLLVAAKPAKRQRIREQLRDAIELFAHSHHGLTQGDRDMGLPFSMSPTVQTMYFGGDNPIDVQVGAYVQHVRSLLRDSDAELTADNEHLRYITETAPGTLVKSLNAAVDQYQREGEDAVRRLARIEGIFWLVTLLLLALEAAFIFHPFTRHMAAVLGKLKQVRRALERHQADLEDVIESRTAELQRRTQELVQSEGRFRQIGDAAMDGIMMIDASQKLVYWNPAAQRIFGYAGSDLLGQNVQHLLELSGAQREALDGLALFGGATAGAVQDRSVEVMARRKDGTVFPAEMSISSFLYQDGWHALGILRDITERHQLETELKRQAHLDYLTGLNNRGHFMELADREFKHAIRYEKPLTIALLDIDHFKQVNDNHGHQAGDEALRVLAQICCQTLRETDVVGRLGGEEFVALLSETAEHEAMEVAQRLRQEVAGASIATGAEARLSITISIGLATLTPAHSGLEELLALADKAMYLAKSSGRDRVCVATSAS